MSAGLSTQGSDAVNALALAGGKGDAQTGAQVCPLHTHTASALCGQCGSAGETFPLLSSRIPSASLGRYNPSHTQSPQENLMKHKSSEGTMTKLPGAQGSWIKGEGSFKPSFLLRSLGAETGHW